MMNRIAKKAGILFAAAAMALTSVSGVTAFANDGTGIEAMDVTATDITPVTMYVTAPSGANVRTAPGTSGRILKALAYNTAVTATGKTSNGWYRFTTTDPLYGGQLFGYISGSLLSTSKQSSNSSSSAAYGYASGITSDGQIATNNAGTPNYVKTSSNSAYKTTYTVNVNGYLALRSDPAFNYSNEIAQLHTGDVVEYRENYGTYWCVYVPATGLLGFVNSNYLV